MGAAGQTARQVEAPVEGASLEKSLQENARLKAKREELLQRIAESEAACASLEREYREATEALHEWEASAGAMLRQNQSLERELQTVRNELLKALGKQPLELSAQSAPSSGSRFFADWAKHANERAGQDNRRKR